MSLTRITGKTATTSAVNKLRRVFRNRGVRHRRTLGFPGGHEPNCDLYAVEAAGIWFSHRLLDQRHWCVFGILPLRDSQVVGITVEMNPPSAGLDRRVAGLFAADSSGKHYLCHTGRVGGGKKGVGRTSFVAWLAEEPAAIVDPDGKSTPAFPIAEIGSPRMVEQIAEYVRAVADFKGGYPAPVKNILAGAFGGSDEEHEGKKDVPGRDAYTASCDHAIVRNRLTDLIAATGRTVSRDQQRDILVGATAKPEAEFEIKTSAEAQCVYTAVGQLLLHDSMLPVKRRVAVLPDPVAPRISRAIASLKIDLVTFRWSDTHIRFKGLDRIFAGVADTAPINRST